MQRAVRDRAAIVRAGRHHLRGRRAVRAVGQDAVEVVGVDRERAPVDELPVGVWRQRAHVGERSGRGRGPLNDEAGFGERRVQPRQGDALVAHDVGREVRDGPHRPGAGGLEEQVVRDRLELDRGAGPADAPGGAAGVFAPADLDVVALSCRQIDRPAALGFALIDVVGDDLLAVDEDHAAIVAAEVEGRGGGGRDKDLPAEDAERMVVVAF